MKNNAILIVEDDGLYAEIIETVLIKEGYNVEVVNDGELAIKRIHEKTFQLMLLDLVLPKVDGFQVLQEVRKNPKTQMMKVIVITNLGQEEDMKRVFDLGANAFLLKAAVSLDEVQEKIREVLKTT